MGNHITATEIRRRIAEEGAKLEAHRNEIVFKPLLDRVFKMMTARCLIPLRSQFFLACRGIKSGTLKIEIKS